MSLSYAISIGVDHSDGLPTCPFAGDEVRALAGHLEAVGIAKKQQTVLIGSAATRSAIDSRLRRLSTSLQATDTAWFVYAGPAFQDNDRAFLACSDTLGDDRTATAIALADVVRLLTANGATIRFLLDAPGLADDELTALFAEASPHVALTANFGNQPSHAAGGRRLWLQLVGAALAGLAPRALRNGKLTASSLHSWTKKELLRVVRKAISTPKTQAPGLFGNPNAFLADVTAVEAKPTAKLDLQQLRRIVFRGEKRGRFKDLSGFQKNYKLPEAATPSSRKWTYHLAADDLKASIEETYNALREQMGFKRKDLESTVGSEGEGFIRTPLFDFFISVSLDPDDPTGVIWRREVSQVSDPAVLRTDGFRQVFGNVLDTLQFDFEQPLDVEDLVDRIEDDPPPGVKVRVTSDGSACDVTVQGFAGRIHVERASLLVEGRPGLTPDSLVEQFFAFQARFGGKKGPLALGG